mmetsp:Transcript_29593/g.72110  ORF Transcript_29593/g.72110 Transcript_29593/m.72110 type:complete len:154 (+) Transcript_29593:214-675(+)
MAIHRIGLDDQPGYYNLATGFLAQYCNRCWNSLLRNDDEYVSRMFKVLNHRNPVCVIHLIFTLGKALLPKGPPDFGEEGEATKSQLNARRGLVRSSVEQKLKEMVSIDTVACSVLRQRIGKTLAQERQEWVSNGKKKVDVFEVFESVKVEVKE